jgi:uncharacterized protein (DUF1015 family)
LAYIQPFRALRYDPARVTVSDVVTQPYDKITPEMQQQYHDASPYNLVRIILGKREASDSDFSNVYTRAAKHFQQWRRDGILLQDRQPSICQYVQRFEPPGGGAPAERRGFIALGRIEDYSAGVVFRHEQTLSKPKADRLNLLRATRAHFGQIFMLYSDPNGEIESALGCKGSPEVDIRDQYRVQHQVWPVTDSNVIETVCNKMRDKKLIIADGHHRYETALSYRNERRANESKQPESPAYDFVMMTFVNMDSPGLLILPTHRVVHGLSSFSTEEFRERAREFFSVEEVDAEIDGKRANAILKRAGQVGTAFIAVCKDRVFLLDRPRAPESLFAGFSFRQQQLDVVQLHKVLLEHVLGVSEEAMRNQQNVRYLRDSAESMNEVRSGSANVAFLMNPARIQQVRDIAFASEVLPQKSTDFYPKLLSGLIIYALE